MFSNRRVGAIISIMLILSVGFVTDPALFFIPHEWPQPTYDFQKNPLSPKGVALGKKLFNDPILSANNTISCSSCHASFYAFAHIDHKLSHGIGDSIGVRNAPTLANLAWQKEFMWDGAIHHLDAQSLAPITDSREMGETLAGLLDKLNSHEEYPTLFEEVFGEKEIKTHHLTKALSQFQLTLISCQSKYDSVKQGLTTFDTREGNGYKLFLSHCNSCHTEPLFTNFTYKNNGIAVDTYLMDVGRYKISQNRSDSLRFKVPTLRNIEFTHPYMHNGSIRSLKGVIQHYAQGANHASNPHTHVPELYLSNQQKNELYYFLCTLSDHAFIRNKSHR